MSNKERLNLVQQQYEVKCFCKVLQILYIKHLISLNIFGPWVERNVSCTLQQNLSFLSFRAHSGLHSGIFGWSHRCHFVGLAQLHTKLQRCWWVSRQKETELKSVGFLCNFTIPLEMCLGNKAATFTCNWMKNIFYYLFKWSSSYMNFWIHRR